MFHVWNVYWHAPTFKSSTPTMTKHAGRCVRSALGMSECHPFFHRSNLGGAGLDVGRSLHPQFATGLWCGRRYTRSWHSESHMEGAGNKVWVSNFRSGSSVFWCSSLIHRGGFCDQGLMVVLVKGTRMADGYRWFCYLAFDNFIWCNTLPVLQWFIWTPLPTIARDFPLGTWHC